MKKLIYCALALAAGLFAASCQQENLEPVAQEGTVTYTIEVPEVVTKAIADGKNVDRLFYEVYKTDAENQKDLSSGAVLLYKKDMGMVTSNEATSRANVTLNLVQNQYYTVLFWAQCGAEGQGVYDVDDLRAVTYKDAASIESNHENYAAFYAVDCISDTTPRDKKVYLKRPFAQLNIGTTYTIDYEKDPYAIQMLKSEVTVKQIPTVFNVATSEVSGVQEFTFNMQNVPGEGLTVNDDPYQYVAMNYMFAGENRTAEVSYTINAKMTAQDGTAIDDVVLNRTVVNVPLKENYRTNIVGNLLTSSTEYEVIVDEKWAKEDDEPYVVNVYSVASAQELIEAVENSSSEGETNIKLEGDIDLNDLFNVQLFSTKAGNDDAPVSLVIPAGKEVILDLQGFKLYQVVEGVVGHNMIMNNGILTIKNGTLEFTDNSLHTAAFNVASNTVKNVGVLIVEEGATIVNKSNESVATYGYPHAIDNFGTLTVNGGTITNAANYSSVRIWCSDDDDTIVTINEGTFNGAIDFHNVSANPNKGTLTINGGTFNADTYTQATVRLLGFGANVDGINAYIKGGHFNGAIKENKYGNVTEFTSQVFFVTGGTFTVDPSAFCADGYGVEKEDDNYTIAQMWSVDPDGNYHIYNVNGLKWVSENVNTMEFYVNQAANIFDNKTVYIENDIDFQGAEWRPIGDYAFSRTSFNGVFDGQNHTISNFKVTEPVRWTQKVTEASYGFFGNVKGTVKNLTIKNATVNPEGGRYSAALVGRLHNGGRIDNCHVEGSSVTINHWQVGGIVGQNNNGNISNCSITGSTITGYAAVGAIVGMDQESGEHTIENCRVSNCSLVQNDTFGASYDATYGLAVGLVNKSNIVLNLNNVVAEDNTIKGVESNTLVGEAVAGAKIYKEGVMQVANKVLHEASGLYYNGNDKAWQSVYYIESANDLKKAAAYFNGQSHSNEANGATIEILTNIDLAGQDWTPWDVMYITLNGNNHTVSNINIPAAWRAGFFAYLGAGKVNDLTLKNVTASGAQAGILAGAIEGVTVNNVKIAGDNTVTYTENTTETWGGIGAFTGIFTDATINGEILSSATVRLHYNDIVTQASYKNKLIGYVAGNYSNAGAITNSGSVEQVGVINSNGVSYVFDYESAQLTIEPKAEYANTVYRYFISDGSSYGITHVKVKDGIERLNNRCFCKNMELVSVELPESLTYIDEGVFQQSGFKTLTIPENVSYIGKQAMGACSNLETIVINAKDVTIANYCARGCAALRSVYIYSDNVVFAEDGNGNMHFTNQESNNTSEITYYVKNQSVADALNSSIPTGHAKGAKIMNIDGTTTYYTR